MTLKCLHDLYDDLAEISSEVIVIDNDSRDGSADAIASEFPNVVLIRNPKNSGFGAANNIGLQQSRGKYIMLLNSDAFLHKGASKALIDYLESNPSAAIVGPRVLNSDGTRQQSCYKFPSPTRAWLENLGISELADGKNSYSKWEHDCVKTVDWVIGACLLLRRSAYEQVGGFDESFFMYQEETDWQKRFVDKGWTIDFTPDAVVTHLGGGSGATEKAKINSAFFDSLDYYMRKHYGFQGLVSVRLAMIVGCGIRAIWWSLMTAFKPKGRDNSLSKAKLQAWLFTRQIGNWRGAGRSAKA
jgi:GT2 family glycosyltransferase